MLNKFVRIFGGDPNKREIEKYSDIIKYINSLETQYEDLSDEALQAKTAEFRSRLAEGETLDDILPHAFAAVREVSKRTIGLRPYDVQLIGGIILHQGKIGEMRTGEGKTLVATLPLYLNALSGKGTHLITVNDYLARRDARWMAPIYDVLGLSVGVLQMASRTENGKKAFVVDLEHESPHEDQNQLRMVPRQEAYASDITYGTNSEFGFDFLRDNMTMRLEDRVQRDHHYAIVDEVDNVLIDEARTPLIISGPAQDDAEWYLKMAQVVKGLRQEDYEISERDRTVTLTEIGESHLEELLGMTLHDSDRPEDVTPEQARLLGYLEQSLRAQFLFRRNKDYLVQAGRVVIVDEFTGRLMPGRRWSDGLHQAVEAKEGARVQAENVTYATITIQNYFRMYDILSGMTGTAVTESEEFDNIYGLDVLAIPTNLEFLASWVESDLVELEGRDEQGFKFRYYIRKEDPQRPVFWKRKDYHDVVYRTEEAKLRALTSEILRLHVLGRPILVGTTSVELSDRISARLRAEPLRRLVQVYLIRHAWFEENQVMEDGRQIEELKFLNHPLDKLVNSELRKMARDLSISFNPEETSNLERLLSILDMDPVHTKRLSATLQGGIPHQVLNARKHTEESQIIEGAGAFGSVTIATNMAGRGVDIVLGGNLDNQTLYNLTRIARNFYRSINRPQDADEMDEFLRKGVSALGYGKMGHIRRLLDWRKSSPDISNDIIGIYESALSTFDRFIAEYEKIFELGGLHVIGSERHEARRIDNQLRGRAARQGDPGSSRFYLSMEDDLMRLFGGEQADALMQRMKIDDSMPLEVGMVSRIVEGSQTRVEGANFDVRKHLLEYDDVLNAQRAKIYAQRNRIFTKDDLSEDVTDMLRTEVTNRVPEALEDEEGPWKLLAWLSQIQPPMRFDVLVFPSYTLRLLADHILSTDSGGENIISPENAKEALLDIAENSINAEEDHLLNTVNNLLYQAQDRLDMQLNERLDILDTFIEGLSLEAEIDTRSPRKIVSEISSAMRTSIRLSSKEQRALVDVDNSSAQDQVVDGIRDQLEASLTIQIVKRLIWSVERRLNEPLDLKENQFPTGDWDALADLILESIEGVFNKRRERLLGRQGDGSQANGQRVGGLIWKDLESALNRIEGGLNRNQLFQLLMLMPQGARTTFDKKTHRRVQQRTTRLSYLYYAAKFLEQNDVEEIAEEVLLHLENAQTAMRRAWGLGEFNRLASSPIALLDETTQNGLREVLGEDKYRQFENQPLQSLSITDSKLVIEELGRQALTEIYRQLLLTVITELWVDYLTQMEALRVSIGLEAYAQRDPLVEYKNRAFGLFQELFGKMRLGVITRMFTYRPRDMSKVQTTVSRADTVQAAEVPSSASETAPVAPDQGKRRSSKKRRRRRRR